MYLFEVPADVLYEIGSWLSGDYLVRLWIASPKLLRTKLEKRDVVRNWTSMSRNVRYFVFPPILSVFRHLATVRLVGPEFNHSPPLSLDELRLLPSTVSFLDLDFAPVLSSFLDVFSDDEPHFSNLRTLYLGKSGALQTVYDVLGREWARWR